MNLTFLTLNSTCHPCAHYVRLSNTLCNLKQFSLMEEENLCSLITRTGQRRAAGAACSGPTVVPDAERVCSRGLSVPASDTCLGTLDSFRQTCLLRHVSHYLIEEKVFQCPRINTFRRVTLDFQHSIFSKLFLPRG